MERGASEKVVCVSCSVGRFLKLRGVFVSDVGLWGCFQVVCLLLCPFLALVCYVGFGYCLLG